MSDNMRLQSVESRLSWLNELYEPMLFYGSNPKIAIEYISDIHLLHHVQFFDGDIARTIRALAKSLWKSVANRFSETKVQVFLGDVSSDRDVTVSFYKRYRLEVLYELYKRFKDNLVSLDEIRVLERKETEYKLRKNRLAEYILKKEAEIEQLKTEINMYVNYSKDIASNRSSMGIKRYLESKYYAKRNLPDHVTEKILRIISINDKISELNSVSSKIDRDITRLRDYSPKNTVKLTDFRKDRCKLVGIVVLGNHEYIGFPDVNEAVEFYKKALEPLGYFVLHNEFVENNKVVIYGGSGFAKYNELYNANNTVCCDAMNGNREYEIEQTTLFEKGYANAKAYALENGKCFICLSHYPVNSCLGKYDKETVYFTGHTHRNELIRVADRVLYADNQVGYHKDGNFDGAIRFKLATTDSARNPYDSMNDGCYLTTPEKYLQFYEYIGEYIGEGKLLRKRCENADFYVIKSQGYYGFFIKDKNGLSIADGGRTKRITSSQNIQWLFDNFNIVVEKYISALGTMRAVQVQISQELKKLGFDGSIHGLIVDIDHLNHVMVNPIDGSVMFYYSPSFGEILQFKSFRHQLRHMGCAKFLDGKAVNSNVNQISLSRSSILLKTRYRDVLNEMTTVSRKTGAYGLSRAISPLQRLFTGHVLRDFDLRLAEIKDESASLRSKSLCGRIYMEKTMPFSEYLVVQDDLGELITIMDYDGNTEVITLQKLRSKTRAETKDVLDTIVRYGDDLPDSWNEVIDAMCPKFIED